MCLMIMKMIVTMFMMMMINVYNGYDEDDKLIP